MKKSVLVLVVVLTAVLGFVGCTAGGKHRYAYVVVEEVFNEFTFKKELEKKYEQASNARKKILDSLQIDVSVLYKRIEAGKPSSEDKMLFDRKRMEFEQKARMFEEENMQMTKDFDGQIIKQLNQYLKDYGKEKDYDLIFGNTSSGSLLYGKEELNITKEVTVYVNQKYNGTK